jgi:hypothetical protein
LIEGLEAEASFYKTDISVDPNSHSILKSEEYKIDSLMQMLKDNPDIPKIIKITKPVSFDENSIRNLFNEYATKNEQNIQMIVEETNEPIGKIICEVSPPNISFKSKAAAYQGFKALQRVSESIATSIAEEEFGTLVAASIKHKLKTSQSTEKETEKAG